MNIRFLETFVWAAKLRSFKAVANKLNISRATVSGRIAALETELDCVLFHRSSKEVLITEAGERILEYAKSILESESFINRALERPQSYSGLVRLGIVESILHTWFPPFIRELQHSYPDIETEITVESTRRLHDLLNRGGLDLALQTDPILGNSVRNRELGSLKMGWFANKKTAPNYLPIKELLKHPIITFTRNSQPHIHVRELLEVIGEKESRLHFVSSITASHRLVEAAMGIATLPTASVTEGMLSRDFRQVLSDHAFTDLKLVASWRSESVDGLSEAVIRLALEQMAIFAEQNPQHASPPIKSDVFTL